MKQFERGWFFNLGDFDYHYIMNDSDFHPIWPTRVNFIKLDDPSPLIRSVDLNDWIRRMAVLEDQLREKLPSLN